MKTSVFGKAVVAGIIGGILIDAFLILTHMASFPGIYQFVASGVVGSVAFSSPNYIWLGVVLHLVISIVWALIYGYVAVAGKFTQRWLVGGIVLGIVVMIGMTIVQMLAHLAPAAAPSLSTLGMLLIAHVVFYGLPVAGYIARA